MTDVQYENKLENPLNHSRLPLKKAKLYKLTTDNEWVQTLLDELNESVDEVEFLKDTTLTIDLEITKKFDDSLGELIIIQGSFSSLFATRCVKTFEPMHDNTLGRFEACFIGAEFKEDEAYQDLTEIYYDGETYELYFHNKGKVDLAEMLHEQIYLEVNQYPEKKA